MNIKVIQSNILAWYNKNWRSLPRRKTKDPYAIHISEVMLQQTQVDRVIPYFHQRMKDFPDYKTLANASKTDLLKHRSWLWFNSRVLRLQQCAKKIIENGKLKMENEAKRIQAKRDWLLFRNCLSSKEGKLEIRNCEDFTELRVELQKLPWIWPYTSAAIMAFARNLPVPVIDTNIRRVLIFLFKLSETITAKELETFAEKIIPKWKSRERHNALMDQWALLLTARKTKIKPLSKQSKFEWSDRQVRWRTMKKIVQSSECRLLIQDIIDEFPRKNVKNILQWMQEEWLITIKKWIIKITQ